MPNTIDINARTINLSNKGLKEIPSDIFKCKRLRKLILRGNNITKIPQEIAQLKGLTLLDLADNKIKTFYAPICKLRNLKILILNKNNISRLPKQITHLDKLKILGLAQNKLKSLPSEMGQMHGLEELNVSGNSFSEFPCFLHQINSLKKLWIRNFNKYTDEEIYSIGNFSSRCKIYEDCNIIFDAQESVRVSNSEKVTPNKIEKEQKIDVNKTQMINQDKPKSKSEKEEKSTIFISYSHADEKWFDRLKVHLSALESLTGSEMKVWSDRELKGGDNIPEEISKALNKAKVAVLMFSPDFLNSDFIRKKEIPPILKKAKELGTVMKPILVKPCLYKYLPDFKDILAMNDLNEPLSKMTPDQNDEVFNKLNEEIIELFKLELNTLK